MSDRTSRHVSREPPISANLRRIGAAFDKRASSIEHLRRLLFLVAVDYFELVPCHEAGNICDDASADMVKPFTVMRL